MRVLVLLVLMWPTYGFSSFESGNSLLVNCKNDDGFKNGVCYGYLMGVVDTQRVIAAWGGVVNDCSPAGLSLTQLLGIVVKRLDDNPEEWHNNGSSLVLNILAEVFPVSFKEDGTSYCP